MCSLVEMQTIKRHFVDLGRDPTDVELETIAQTWSEHCSHKTLAGRIAYRDENGERHFENMLKETIFAATQEIRERLGRRRLVRERLQGQCRRRPLRRRLQRCLQGRNTQPPSALEPYGGANTGIGGVIRDPMGTGMGAKPVCNTDVFCFAPPDTPADRCRPACCIRDGDERRRLRRPRLRQPDGHSHRQRRRLLRRRATWATRWSTAATSA
jgi:phosphoribosylformylglycinamidine (FGAM) synthase-like enzyme